MKILHISTRLILGGSQENTILSCEAQARLGHEVHLAYGPIYGPEGSMLERVQRFNRERRDAGQCPATPGTAPIGLHEVGSMEREIMPRTDLRCLRELRELIERLSPDIVHTHSSKAGILGRLAAHRAARGMRRPMGIVHTIHGPPFMPLEGDPLRRFKTGVKNTMYTIAERFAATRCHVIVSVADAMTREFLARGIGRPEQYTTVFSGMDLTPYVQPAPEDSRESMRRVLGLGERDFVIGTVARLAEHKGHDDLLNALRDDLREHPDWKLLWVGDGWLRERLFQRASDAGIKVGVWDGRAEEARGDGVRRAQLILTGMVPPERVPAMIRAMDVLAHPSYREGLPRTVPQALLCGVCPIAYDVDGTGEACIDMQTGRLVRVGDIEGLRRAVEWAAQHPAERAVLAARGNAMCLERFGAERMAAELEKVYAEAIRLAEKTHG